MMSRRRLYVALVLAVGLTVSAAGRSWESIQAEPNLERRSKLALDFAHTQIQPIIDAYFDGKPDDARSKMDEIVAAVNLSSEALEKTGRHARRNPKPFKYAEIQTRKLVSKLKEAQRELNFDEQSEVDDLIAKVEVVNEKLLLAIMSRKPK